jgi:hypothetical protein
MLIFVLGATILVVRLTSGDRTSQDRFSLGGS